MSGTTIHKRARTTPQLHEEIQNSSLPERALAEKYNVSRSTVRKWKHRETASDRSHQALQLHTALSPGAGGRHALSEASAGEGPFHLRILLTDNDQAFTDRFTQKGWQP